MKSRYLKAGSIIYSSGDVADAVHVILHGRVEVSRRTGRRNTVLAELGRGQIFGEMGVLRDTPRETTVVAQSDVNLVSISKDKFLAAIRTENAIAVPLLKVLCQRLGDADARLAAGDHDLGPGVPLGQVRRLRLLPASPTIETQIGGEGMAIEDLPFIVGRRLDPGEPPLEAPHSLTLANHDSYQMSPTHFAVEEYDRWLVVRDHGSYLGTCVNGSRIAHFEQHMIAGLRFGENDVVAGGADSHYRFTIIVERSDGAD